MPSADAILRGLSATANEFQWLAFAWHVLLVGFLVAVAAGWRPSQRSAGFLLAPPFVSVSLLAWRAGNPFNGTTMAALAVGLSLTGARLPLSPIGFAAPMLTVVGLLMILFGATYPHFLAASAWYDYVHSAPLGLVPCPTLSVAIGIALLFGLFRSAAWTIVLAIGGVFYGVFGVAMLGVSLDLGLVAGATVLAFAATTSRAAWPSVRARPAERSRVFPGDSFIKQLLGIAGRVESLPAIPSRTAAPEQERKRA
jgi:hypothetical protein